MPERKIANTAELSDGQMKACEIDDHQILLLRKGEEYFAYGGECPHHGAPLAEGLLQDGCVVCPWHLAMFGASTGEMLEPVAIDNLPAFEVRVEGEDVLVDLPDDVPAVRHFEMVRGDEEKDGRIFVIVGGGAAGSIAAETLRREGFQGRIVLLSRDPDRPYERTELSKRFLRAREPGRPFLREEGFYERHDIELRTGEEVTSVNPDAKTVACADQRVIRYDKLLLATGGGPRRLDVDGAGLDGVYTLRSLADAEAIRERMQPGSAAVVVGASFIAMEVAAGLVKHEVPTDIVAPEEVPFAHVLGERIGNLYRRKHEEKGVNFRLGRTVKRFEGDGKLEAVILDDDTRLKADFALMGVGVRPRVGYLKQVDLCEDGSVAVDDRMQIRGREDIYAAGDIATFPDWRTGEDIRFEHWRVALQQGIVAGRSMAGKETHYRELPFFWTNQYMVITDYLGYAKQWDEVSFDGDPDEEEFVAYYIKGGCVHALATCGRSDALTRAAMFLRQSPLPKLDELRGELKK